MNAPDRATLRLVAAAERLRTLAAKLARGDAASAVELDEIVAEITGARRELFGLRTRAPRGEGARAKILTYLQAHEGETVAGEELAAVSGIQEWARRVRELRDEFGYEISELGGSLYRLERAEPDLERARQWQLANEIRRRRGGARDRIGAYLEAQVGEVVSREQIDYVGRIAEGIRRVRELRDELGWPIDSHIDDPSLKSGEYRLLSTEPDDRRDPLQRLYPEELRQRVFERDDYTCRICHRNRQRAIDAGDTRFYLELHHRVAVADELAELPKSERNKQENLLTLCHPDHLAETAKLQERKRRERRR